MIIASVNAGCPRGLLHAARAIGASLAGDGRSLAVATLISWLLTESLGAYMLSRLLTSGERRAQPRGVFPPVMFGHAGLAFTGFVCWVAFLATSSEALAWLAVGLLAPAIGLGISAVTVWTPYPTHHADPKAPAGACRDRSSPAWPAEASPLTGEVSTENLADALRDDAVTSNLVDDLAASLLTAPAPPPRRIAWRLSPLIPAAHGVLAVVTFLLATLAAVAVTSAGT
jgi:hypothetical protein